MPAYETFTPEAYGWKIQRDYNLVPQYPVVEDERELGNITSTALADKPSRRLPLTFLANDRAAYEYMASFFNRHRGPTGRFYYLFPELVPTPDVGPTLTAIAGGAQGSRTIFAKYAWKNAQGTTRASPATSLLVPANNLLKLALPSPGYPPSVTQAVIYATQGAAGTEVEQTILTNVLTWTQPDGALLLGNPAPAIVNTAKEFPLMKLMGDPVFRRGDGLNYLARLDLQEVYSA